MSSAEDFALYIERNDMARVERRPLMRTDLAPGEARLSVEGLALTANTLTYAVTGEALGFWRFFPAPEPLGLIPTWGIARVSQSRCPELPQGDRWFGFLPLASTLVVSPKMRGAAQFLDAASHRQALPANYNLYRRVDADPFFLRGREEECALLRPLAMLSFLIVEHLKALGVAETDQVVLTSASSKAALAAGHLARETKSGRWIGLTSATHAAFVRQTGAYDMVASYEAIETLDATPRVLLDFSGNGIVRARAQARWSASLQQSYLVGAAHGDASRDSFGADSDATLFFVPDVMKAAIAAHGLPAFEARFLEAWRSILAWTPDWLSIDRRVGVAGLESAYQDLLRGAVPPDRGLFVRMQEGGV